MESLGYTMMYLLKGKLPWQGVKRETKNERYEAIKLIKKGMAERTEDKEWPQAFINYLKHCRELDFEKRPDYDYLRKLIKDCFTENGFEHDMMFDWFVQKVPAAAEKGVLGRRRFASTSRL
eukprot:TRINITY_DN3914_c0_g1_i4.p2 TRINITY_DN3914_c0_g1~~TRINITY_DN3914_c0_g1_i4.p2  ORF type:complete len:121 (-),score=34.42 TRINITY_DN3914_c0_g1_i4:139-501(-)